MKYISGIKEAALSFLKSGGSHALWLHYYKFSYNGSPRWEKLLFLSALVFPGIVSVSYDEKIEWRRLQKGFSTASPKGGIVRDATAICICDLPEKQD